MKKYTKDHEWIEAGGGTATVGISGYAQKALGDLVFVELPKAGAVFTKGAEAAVVESVKAASEVYAPAGGEVIAVNAAVAANPALVNASPEQDGWLFKLKLENAAELDDLMDAKTYQTYVESLA
ncbi:MAG TPA: glycine cleavage system protein GcvH [Sphingomonadales bacterium]|nr:glycine cleavage system protein GcvH [Sphingomonadales bacterium]